MFFHPLKQDISIITGSCVQLAVQMFEGQEVILFCSHPHNHIQQWGHVLWSKYIHQHPNWTATTCSSDFWERLISCPGLWEESLLLQTSRVTGVNSPTRGRFTDRDRNHLSALCCHQTGQTEHAFGQSHNSKVPYRIKTEWTRDTSWCMVVSCHVIYSL